VEHNTVADLQDAAFTVVTCKCFCRICHYGGAVCVQRNLRTDGEQQCRMGALRTGRELTITRALSLDRLGPAPHMLGDASL
jgi:hypothetical protein